MELAAEELALGLSCGPPDGVRDELRRLLPGLCSLKIMLNLVRTPRVITASTPNVLAAEMEPWRLRLSNAEDVEFVDDGPKTTLSDCDELNLNNEAPGHDTLKRRLETNGNVQVLAPIAFDFTRATQENESTPPPAVEPRIGFILAEIQSAFATSRDSEIAVLALAQALSMNARLLKDFATSVSSLLFARPHSKEADLSVDSDDALSVSGSESASEFGTDPIGAERAEVARGDQQWDRLPNLRGLSVSLGDISLTLKLRTSELEAAFSQWHALHMWKFDVGALALCTVSHSILVFMPGTAYGLFQRASNWQWLGGYTPIIPLSMLCVRDGRAWYLKHRDAVLLAMQIAEMIYNHFTVENFRLIRPIGFLGCSTMAYGFLWLPFMTLIAQMRFALLAPTVLTFLAINLQLLPIMCEDECGHDMLARRCIGRGASKVVAIMVAALCVVYCIEWRARRLWVTLVREANISN